jgi:hypothetical protein
VLNALYCNARSIVSKIKDLELIADEKKPDIILITESWCNSDTPNTLLNIPNYYIDAKLRVDRNDTYNGIGGGLLVYVRNGLHILTCDNNSDFNQYCTFNLLNDDKTTDFVVTLVYRSPNSNQENTDKLCELLKNLPEADNHFIIGDFNMTGIDWRNLNACNKYKNFVDITCDKSLEQLVNFPTHNKGNTLDLVFSNFPDRILNVENIGNLGNSDHAMISIDILSELKTDPPCDDIPDWSNADYGAFEEHILNSNMETNMNGMNTENSWEFFKQVITTGIKNFVPMKKRRINTKPVWINKHVTRLSRQKRRRFAIYCNDRTEENLKIYKKVEKECKKAVRNAKRKFEKKLATSTNKKPFNSYLRSKTKSRSGVGPIVHDNRIVTEAKEMSTILNSYFSSVFVADIDGSHVPDPAERAGIIPVLSLAITKLIIAEKIDDLKNTNSCGPDNIPTPILKKFRDILTGPLAVIFNKSLKSGIVPNDWKLANVTPIYKKGSKGLASNYRPISLTSVLCKLLESIIRDALTAHIDRFKLLNQSQHGFLKGKSCTTNLLEFTEKVMNCLDDSTPVDIIYLDFAKAFDKVSRKKLMRKVKNFGIKGDLYTWIENWLTGRKQRVVINGKESDWIEVESGVPQGSVLGPLLFLIFIDDIDEYATLIEILRKFADDTKLGHPVRNDRDREMLQAQLDSIFNWSQTWGMTFNIDKCKVMHVGRTNQNYEYTMNGQKLQETEYERDVGVMFDNSMKPGMHCRNAARTARAILKQIGQAFHYRDRYTFLNLYKRYVRVHMEFATPAWNPWQLGDVECLEKVQMKAVSMISGLRSDNYLDKLKELKLLSLTDRRIQADIVQTFKILKGIDKVDPSTWFKLVDPNRPATRATNVHNSLQIDRKRTELANNFFTTRAAKQWNDLPDNIKGLQNLSTFKKKVAEYLASRNQ